MDRDTNRIEIIELCQAVEIAAMEIHLHLRKYARNAGTLIRQCSFAPCARVSIWRLHRMTSKFTS
jgi:hypothetical protein